MSNIKWDLRFLEMAEVISRWSKDPSTKVGAVLVDSDRRIVSLGYNGFARSVRDDDSRYSDRSIKYKIVVHAEENAILFSKGLALGSTIYTVPMPPCAGCAAIIIQSGITRVVSWLDGINNERWSEEFKLAEMQYEEAGIDFCLIGKGNV